MKDVDTNGTKPRASRGVKSSDRTPRPTMTDLDRRVAKWRGWTLDNITGRWSGSDTVRGYRLDGQDYSPSTNLLQAFALWDEARPEGWLVETKQFESGDWAVYIKHKMGEAHEYDTCTATLPRALTEAWVEAREATCQKD